MDRELLSTYGQGLIATTGCPVVRSRRGCASGSTTAAREAAAEFRDIFGAENFYCELMDHGLGIERRVHKDLLRLASDLGLPLVATNDLHYTRAEDAQAHAVAALRPVGVDAGRPEAVQVRRRRLLPQESRSRCATCGASCPRRATTRCSIAERCDVTFTEGANLHAALPCPGRGDRAVLVRQGGRARAAPALPGRHPRRRAQAGRLRDRRHLARWASRATSSSSPTSSTGRRSKGIRVGPGSRLGAPARWRPTRCGITDLDPLPHGLIFERFLNPERVSMPDFDVDFDERRRGEVIRYVTEKYGEERVAQIVTYGTIKAKQALKDAARVLGYPFAMGERLTKAMPPPSWARTSRSPASSTPSTRATPRRTSSARSTTADPEVAEGRRDGARAREPQAPVGRARGRRHHVAASRSSTSSRSCAASRTARSSRSSTTRPARRSACSRWTSSGCATSRSSTTRSTTSSANRQRAARPRRDLRRSTTRPPTSCSPAATRSGVFQLDGGPMRSLLRLDAARTTSRTSPPSSRSTGPGRWAPTRTPTTRCARTGSKPITPIHPELAEPLAEILDATYGLIVYQEQVMAIAQKVAGYSLGKADLLRRAMGKKKKRDPRQGVRGLSRRA